MMPFTDPVLSFEELAKRVDRAWSADDKTVEEPSEED